MTTSSVRPRFEIEADIGADTLMEWLRARLPRCPHCTGVSVGRHPELFIPDAERRVWSPWLSVTAHDRVDSAILRGRFVPHPHIWTLYLFVAFGLGFALLVGTTWGHAQWAMERTAWAWVSIPIIVMGGLLLYLASQVGQRLGREQMCRLRLALEELVR